MEDKRNFFNIDWKRDFAFEIEKNVSSKRRKQRRKIKKKED